MKYHFKVHKEGSGYWAECIELSGCFSQANSLIELRKNLEEALNLYIEEPENSKKTVPLPNEEIVPTRSIIEVPVDPSIAFAFMVRYHRLQRGLTQRQAAHQLGFESLYSYQRLENKKCNPTLKILCHIKKAFPDFSVDLALPSF